MLDLTDHFLRKAYSLSLNEYGVLVEIYWLSHNTKYGGWCVASREYIAESLDLGRATTYRTIEKLIEIGLVEKEPELKHLRTTDKFNSVLAERRNFAMSVKTQDEEVQVIAQPKQSQIETHRLKMRPTVSKRDCDSLKMRQTPSQNETVLIQDTKNINNLTLRGKKKFIKLEQVGRDRLYKRLAEFRRNLGREPNKVEYRNIMEKLSHAS